MSICKVASCEECSRKEDCGGCREVDGHPFGGACIAAEAVKRGGLDELLRIKNELIAEFNSLGIEGLKVEDLNLLNGAYINLEYTLANGQSVRLLEDNNVYFGNQVEKPDSERCYGICADDKYMIVCEYGCSGENPEIILYKKRSR